jgi:glycosyltransferase involved in cell wall biosynthesis
VTPADRAIVTTLVNDRPQWAQRVRMIDRGAQPAASVTARLVAAGLRGRTLVLLGSAGFGARYADLLAAVAVARGPRSPAVVLAECTWEPGSAALARRLRVGGNGGAARLAVRAVDGDRVTFCVLSRAERERFPRTWGVAPDRVAFTPFTVTLGEAQLAPPPSLGDAVFAGGNSLRDYGPLLDAAGGIPAPIVLATNRIGPHARLAPNVRAGLLPHARYVEELRLARAVVVPLAENRWRSAGQQTYLNAMALGKPVVVTDTMGVRDYVEHGVTGLVVPPGDARAMGEAVRWVLDPANAAAVDAMSERARRTARERFTLDRYLTRLLEVASATVARRAD